MLPEYKDIPLDKLYEQIKKDPLTHIRKVKEQGITNLISIGGVIGGDFDNSNGSGKSTILESICYAFYDKIARKNLQVDSAEKAGASVITKINGEYPEDLKETYVEMIFEENEKVYILKRGRALSKSDKESKRSPKPILEFKCVNEDGIDSQSGHRTGDTNDTIAKVINLDYDLFCSSIMFGQGSDGGKFLVGTDSTRKEMLIGLLHLENVVSGCLEKVREKKNAKEKDRDNLVAQINLISDNIKAKQPIDGLKQQITEKEKQIVESEKKSNTYRNEIEDLSKSDVLKELEAIKLDGKRIQANLNEKKKQKETHIQEWSNLSKNASESVSKKTNDIHSLELKVKETKDKIDTNRQKIELFNSAEKEKDLAMVEKAKQYKPKCDEIISELQKNDIKINRDIAVEVANLKRYEAEIYSLQKQINNAGSKLEFVCDKCRSIVSKTHIEKELDKNLKEKEKADKEIKKYNDEQTNLHSKIQEQNNKLTKVNDWIGKEGKIHLEIQQHENNKSKQVELIASQEEYVKSLEKYGTEKLELEKQRIQYQDKIVEINKQYDGEILGLNNDLVALKKKYVDTEESSKGIKSKIEILRSQVEEISRNKASYNSQIGSIRKEIEGIEEDAKKLDRMNKKLIEENAIFNRLLILDSCFGLDGIQTRIINKYLPLLNIYIKEFMDVLSDGMLSVSLVINDRSKVDVIIKGGTASAYEMLSGGEKMLLRLSISVGLSILSFVRCAQKPQIICLDEIFGPLDASHIETVFKLLSKLQDKFNRVLIISHNTAINDRIPHQILVEKDEGMYGRSRIRSIS